MLPEGIYDYQVAYAEDKISHAGNEYIFLKLSVYDIQGRERLIFTNLAFIKLLKHFCDAHGLQEKYKNGELLAEDCLGKIGKCEIGIEKGKANPNGGFYSDKNIVKDYFYKKDQKPIEKKVELNDDLPDFLV